MKDIIGCVLLETNSEEKDLEASWIYNEIIFALRQSGVDNCRIDKWYMTFGAYIERSGWGLCNILCIAPNKGFCKSLYWELGK